MPRWLFPGASHRTASLQGRRCACQYRVRLVRGQSRMVGLLHVVSHPEPADPSLPSASESTSWLSRTTTPVSGKGVLINSGRGSARWDVHPVAHPERDEREPGANSSLARVARLDCAPSNSHRGHRAHRDGTYG